MAGNFPSFAVYVCVCTVQYKCYSSEKEVSVSRSLQAGKVVRSSILLRVIKYDYYSVNKYGDEQYFFHLKHGTILQCSSGANSNSFIPFFIYILYHPLSLSFSLHHDKGCALCSHKLFKKKENINNNKFCKFNLKLHKLLSL